MRGNIGCMRFLSVMLMFMVLPSTTSGKLTSELASGITMEIMNGLKLELFQLMGEKGIEMVKDNIDIITSVFDEEYFQQKLVSPILGALNFTEHNDLDAMVEGVVDRVEDRIEQEIHDLLDMCSSSQITQTFLDSKGREVFELDDSSNDSTPTPWNFVDYGGATVFFDFGLTAVPGKKTPLAKKFKGGIAQFDIDLTANAGRAEDSNGSWGSFGGLGLSFGVSAYKGSLPDDDGDEDDGLIVQILKSTSVSVGVEFLHSAGAYGGFSVTVSLLLPENLRLKFSSHNDSAFGLLDLSITFTVPDFSCLFNGNIAQFRNGFTLGSWAFTFLEVNLHEVITLTPSWLRNAYDKGKGWYERAVTFAREVRGNSDDGLDHLREQWIEMADFAGGSSAGPPPPPPVPAPPVVSWATLDGIGLAVQFGITIYDSANGWLWQAYPLQCPDPPSPPAPSPPTPGTTPSREVTTLGTEREVQTLATSEGVRVLLGALGSFFGNKSVSTDFCLGDCNPSPVENKAIEGFAYVGIECTGFLIEAELDDLTVGSVSYIIGGDPLWDIVNGVGLEAMGFQKLDMSLKITLPHDVLFNVSSTATFLKHNLTASLIGAIGTDPNTGSRDTRIAVTGSYNPKPSGTFHFIEPGIDLSLIFVLGQEADMQMGVKFVVCVADCTSMTPQELEFDGSIVLRLPEMDVSASFRMIDTSGWWLNAFGLPFFHLGELVLQLGLNIEEMEPYAFEFGGEMCLGKADNCQQQTDPHVNFIGFIGLNDQFPEQNFVAVMVSKLTIDEVLSIIGEWVPLVASLDSSLPSKVKETGLYPHDLKPTNCDLGMMRNATDTTSINKRCFAYFMYAGIDKTIPLAGGQELVIPQGVSLSGRLDLLGWNLYADISVSPTNGMLFNITSDPLKLKIAGADLVDLTSFTNPSEGPIFFLQLNDTFTFTLDAQLKMPLVLLEAHVFIHADSRVFAFNGDVSLFDGLWKVGVDLEWDWDGTYFYLKATDAINFADIVKVDTVVLNVTDSPGTGVAAQFDCEISVLFIISLEAQLNYTPQAMAFDVHVEVLGITSGVRGHAEMPAITPGAMPPAKIEDADWQLSVYSDIAQALEEIGKDIAKAVSAAVNEVENLAKDAIQGLETAGKELMKAFSTIYNDVKEFAEMLEDDVIAPLMEDVVSFLEDPTGFMQSEIFNIPVIGTLLKWALTPIHWIIGSKDRSGNYGIDPRTQCTKYWKQHCSFAIFGGCVSGWGDTQEWIDPNCYKSKVRVGAQAKETNATIAVHQNILNLTASKQSTIAHLDANASQYKVTAPSMNATLNGTQPFTHNFAGTFHIPSDAPGFGNLSSINFSLALQLDPSSNESFTNTLQQAIEQVKAHVTQHTAAAIYYKAPAVLQKLNVTIKQAKLEDPGDKQAACNSTHILTPPKMDYDQICQDGARVVLLSHVVEELQGDQCGTILHHLSWQGVVPACNMTTEVVNQTVTILPVRPAFETVPKDVVIASWSEDTGRATAEETCGDHIVWYKDQDPTTNAECGSYSFNREWFVAPGGLSCKLDPSAANPLISSHIQKISIESPISVQASYLKPNITPDEYFSVPAVVTTVADAPLTSYGTNLTGLLPRGLRDSMVAYPLNANSTLRGFNLTCCTDDPCRFAIFFTSGSEKGTIYPELIKEGWVESTCNQSVGSSVRKNLTKGEYKVFDYIENVYIFQDHEMPDDLCVSKEGPEGQCQVCSGGPCCDPTINPRQPCPGGMECCDCGTLSCQCPAATPVPTTPVPEKDGCYVCSEGDVSCCDPRNTAGLCPGGLKCCDCGTFNCKCPAEPTPPPTTTILPQVLLSQPSTGASSEVTPVDARTDGLKLSNGGALGELPDYLKGFGGHLYYELPVVTDGGIHLTCPLEEMPSSPPAVCTFYLVSWHCSPCSKGGWQGLLVEYWEAHAGPTFKTGVSDYEHQTVVYRKDIPAGETEVIPTTELGLYQGIFAASHGAAIPWPEVHRPKGPWNVGAPNNMKPCLARCDEALSYVHPSNNP